MIKSLFQIIFIGTIIHTMALPSLFSQDKAMGYYFEGDEVVFEFDPRVYAKATIDGTADKLDFSDLDVYKVVVTGSFNKWSKKGWKMKKISDYKYQLRKKITNFDDQFTWEFKFLVNNKYWAEPDPAKHNTNRIFENIFLEEVYNLKLQTIEASKEGKVRFFLKGYPTAEKVILAGTFNAWDEEFLHMDKVEEGWELRADLPAGYYEYKFIVDGEWMHDPANPKKKVNEHNTFNSILEVVKTVTFKLADFPEAEKVVLAGSFNDWNEDELKMRKEGDHWILHLDMNAGKHWYKFIVDGEWMVDPQNPLQEYDRDGYVNSVLIVN
jgi:hypothetical protein